MTKQKINTNLIICYLPYAILFLVPFFYFLFFADHIFFSQEKSSLFIFSKDFLVENLHQPGSLLVYFAKFLTSFYYYPVAGSLILSSTIVLITFVLSWIIRSLSRTVNDVFPFITGIVIFWLCTNYQFLAFNSLGLLLQLAAFYLAIRYFKVWVSIIIFPLWYFITGGFTWIFFIMFTLWLATGKRKFKWIEIAALWLLSFATIYISGSFLFFQTIKALLIYPLSKTETGSQFILFTAVAVVLSLLPVLARIKINTPVSLEKLINKVRIIPTVVLFILMVAISFAHYDLKAKQYFYVEKLFYQNRFNDIVAYNIKYPSKNLLTLYLNNIALCETGKLDDMLFHFQQSPDGRTLFLKWEAVQEILNRGGYFYYTIGMINEAHRWAFENMVIKGHTPEGLKMLIRTELINSNFKPAAKYINILKKTLFYRNDAKAYEKLLFNDAAIDSDHELGEKRKIKLKTDFFSIYNDPYINILRILATDTLNRKALEYKLAFIMLNKDLKSLAKELPRLKSLGFIKIPVHVEEAAAAYKIFNPGPFTDLGILAIDQNTELRLKQFYKTIQMYGNDQAKAEPALRKQFGNTYWYWVFYR